MARKRDTLELDPVELEEGKMTSLDDFDARLLEAAGNPKAYREWAQRLCARTDGVGDTIRLAQAVHGVDDAGEYRINRLLSDTNFVTGLNPEN